MKRAPFENDFGSFSPLSSPGGVDRKMRQPLSKPLIFASRGDDPYRTTTGLLSRLPASDYEGKRVLIKPNAARIAAPGEGVTTHPGVVAAVIDFLKERRAREIVVGESCIFGVAAGEAFRKAGLEETAAARKVSLVDLDRLDPVEIRIPRGRLLKKIRVSSLLHKVDLVVSVPVLKTHMHTGVTLGIKNLKGLLWKREKARFHHLASNPEVTKGEKELDWAIAEMATALSSHLVVADGSFGMEGMGPGYGKAKKMGVVVAGENALAADAVAARLMGFDPAEIPHLRLCRDFGLGEVDLARISVDPPDFRKWENPFERPPSKISISYPDVTVYDRGSCSACLSTLMVFLQKQRQNLDGYRLEDRKFHVGIGKYIGDFPEGTVLLGNCTQKFKDRGVFVQGCPPVSSQILEALSRRRGKKRQGRKDD
jgi:uncharacterized protein (DUF362 family)